MKKVYTLLVALSLALSLQAQKLIIEGDQATILDAHPGCLIDGSLKTDQLIKEISTVTIEGKIDARDFKFLRDELLVVRKILLNKAYIVEYSGKEGTQDGTYATYPENTIPVRAFSKSDYTLEYIALPDAAIAIDNDAFSGSNLSVIDMPSTLKRIGSFAFAKCRKLMEIKLPSELEILEPGAFYGCEELQSINIGHQIRVIAKESFYNCISLKYLIFDDLENSKLTSIEGVAFEGCISLGELNFPSSIQNIGFRAFASCSSLYSITFPDTKIVIEDQAFAECKNALNVYAKSPSPEYYQIAPNAFEGAPLSSCILRVPEKSLEQYKNAPPWAEFVQIVEGLVPPTIITKSVTNITSTSAVAIMRIASLGDVSNLQGHGFVWSTSSQPTLNDQLIDLGPTNELSDFKAEITGLSPNTTYYIRSFAMNVATSKEAGMTYGVTMSFKTTANVIIEGTKATIKGATAGCLVGETTLTKAQKTIITQVVLQGTMDARDFKVMRDEMPALSIVELSGATIAAYTGALGTASTATITYPGSTIPANAFQSRTSLTSVILPGSIVGIQANAFYQCAKIPTLSLPATVVSLGESAFYGMTGLKTFKVYSATPANISTLKTIFTGIPTSCVLRVPNGSMAAYQAATNWKYFTNIVVGYVPATVSTPAVSNILANSATGYIKVLTLGDVNPIQYGLVWSTSPTPTVALTTKTTLGALTKIGTFASSITGLSPNTTYYVRAYASNASSPAAVGTVYGEQVLFTTPTAISVVVKDNIATITNCEAGCLLGDNVLKPELKASLSGLVIATGSIDARDIRVMRDEMTALKGISLYDATIKEFTGKEGTEYGTNRTYSANTMPIHSFVKYDSPLTSIIMPESVYAIESEAFEGSSLTNIKLPSTLAYIGSFAFAKSEKLIDVKWPSIIEKIEDGAFYGCVGLPNLTIGRKIGYIGKEAFYNCSSLKTITYEDFNDCRLTRIEPSTFEGCKSLEAISIPQYIESIANRAFAACGSLKTITFPEAKFVIEDQAFIECESLATVAVYSPDPNTYQLAPNAFEGVQYKTCVLRVPEGSMEKYMNTNPWNEFVNVAEGVVPPTLTMKEVANVTSSAAVAVMQVVDLGSATMLEGHGLVWSKSPNPTFYDQMADLGAVKEPITDKCELTGLEANTTYYVRPFALNRANTKEAAFTYGNQMSFNTKNSNVVIEGTKAIISNAKAGSLVGENTLTKAQKNSITQLVVSGIIDARDFRVIRDEMPALNTVTLSNTSIATYSGKEGTLSYYTTYCANDLPTAAFKGNRSLAIIELPKAVQTIGSGAFAGSVIESMSFPSTVGGIKDNAFANCERLKSIDIPSTIKMIDSEAFRQCSSLESVTLSSSLVVIERAVFAECYQLKSIVIPSGVECIAEKAFAGCKSLAFVSIPASVYKLQAAAFAYCGELKEINLDNPKPIDLGGSPEVFANVPTENCTLRVPVGCVDNYRNAYQWDKFVNIIEGLKYPTILDVTASEESGVLIVKGELVDFGDVVPETYGVVWSLKPNPTVAKDKYVEESMPTTQGTIWQKIQYLEPDKTYYLRFFTKNNKSSNDAGVYYSEELSFSMNKAALSIAVAPVVDFTKIYDGRKTTSLTTIGTLSGINPADAKNVIVTATANYSTEGIGTNKTITVSYKLSGSAAWKYAPPADYVITSGQIYKALSVKIVLEGLWNKALNQMNKCKEWNDGLKDIVDKFPGDVVDTVTVELHHSTYKNIAYIFNGLELHQDGKITSVDRSAIAVPPVVAGNYYITIKSRNHLETTTATTVTFIGSNVSYDFTDDVSKAFKTDYLFNPTKANDGKIKFYAGEVLKDADYPEINLADLYEIFNKKSSNTEKFGYQQLDVNGDGEVDDADVYLIFENLSISFYLE